MKKRIITLLIVTLACLMCLFAFVACGSTGGGDGGTTPGSNGDGTLYTITFNPNGGVIEGADADGKLTIEVYDGDKIPEPVVSKEGSSLNGWFKGQKESDRWRFDSMEVHSDLTLTAYWRKVCDHDYVEDAVKSYAATCTEAGRSFMVCSKCGMEDPQLLPKLGHDLKSEDVEATCATAPYTRTYCARQGCDYELKDVTGVATGLHDWHPEYTELIPATSYIPGKEIRYCLTCQKEIPTEIPALKIQYDLAKLQIGNYTYTDSVYTDEPFVNITSYAGIYASSYYSICEAKNMGDGSPDNFWCADTLADGSSYTGDVILIEFDKRFDIGAINFILPVYSAWGLGDDCYVAYDLSIRKEDGTWEKVATISDKEVSFVELYGNLLYEFDEHVTTDAIQLTVAKSSRYAPAMIYELEIFAKAPATERVAVSLNSQTSASISGRLNDYAGGAPNLIDGSYLTGWQIGIHRPENHQADGIYAILDFTKDKFIAGVQFTVSLGNGKKYELYYWENEQWVLIGTYEITKKGSDYIFTTNTGDYYSSGSVINAGSKADPNNIGAFTTDLDKNTSKIKLQVIADNQWNDYVYSLEGYTVIQRAKGIDAYGGCTHAVWTNQVDTAPTCENAGYSTLECLSCKVKVRTDAVDALGHSWGEYAPVEGTETGVVALKESACETCGNTRRITYTPEYMEATITKYLNNAPSAWAQTYDDGNYISTYEWLVPKLQEYNYRATAVLTVGMMSGYTENWKGYFATGAIDLGSHSYNHLGIYSGPLVESGILGDVFKAHYWFMNAFPGQQLMCFATPNGGTSEATANYVTGIMAANRNGGASSFINETEKLTSRLQWGNLGTYVSKLEQTEGLFLFVKDGKFVEDTKYEAIFNKNGSYGKPGTLNEETGTYTYGTWDGNWVSGAKVNSNGQFVYDEEGNITSPAEGEGYIAVKLFGGYRLIHESEANELQPVNYVYDPETNRLQISEANGTYYYDAEKYQYVWKESGSYVDDGNGNLVYSESDESGYKLYHVALGTYEKGINQLLESGGWTIECLHGLSPSFEKTEDYIQTSYTSTIRKFDYLKQTGIWVCSYTDIVQYQKEYQNAYINTISRDETKIELELTDTLDDIMFDQALTIKVDIPDDWTTLTATQDGKAIDCFIEDGFAYVNAVPDRGTIVVTQ